MRLSGLASSRQQRFFTVDLHGRGKFLYGCTMTEGCTVCGGGYCFILPVARLTALPEAWWASCRLSGQRTGLGCDSPPGLDASSPICRTSSFGHFLAHLKTDTQTVICWHFFLDDTNEAGMPDTVKGRCQNWALVPQGQRANYCEQTRLAPIRRAQDTDQYLSCLVRKSHSRSCCVTGINNATRKSISSICEWLQPAYCFTACLVHRMRQVRCSDKPLTRPIRQPAFCVATISHWSSWAQSWTNKPSLQSSLRMCTGRFLHWIACTRNVHVLCSTKSINHRQMFAKHESQSTVQHFFTWEVRTRQ